MCPKSSMIKPLWNPSWGGQMVVSLYIYCDWLVDWVDIWQFKVLPSFGEEEDLDDSVEPSSEHEHMIDGRPYSPM